MEYEWTICMMWTKWFADQLDPEDFTVLRFSWADYFNQGGNWFEVEA